MIPVCGLYRHSIMALEKGTTVFLAECSERGVEKWLLFCPRAYGVHIIVEGERHAVLLVAFG